MTHPPHELQRQCSQKQTFVGILDYSVSSCRDRMMFSYPQRPCLVTAAINPPMGPTMIDEKLFNTTWRFTAGTVSRGLTVYHYFDYIRLWLAKNVVLVMESFAIRTLTVRTEWQWSGCVGSIEEATGTVSPDKK